MTAKGVKWDFTTKCNMRCRHCSVGKQYFTRHVQEIGLEQKLRIVEKLAFGGVKSISFLGGEPLVLTNDFFEVAAVAKEHGIRITLVSNGLLLTEPYIDRIIRTGIDTVVVSLDGSCDSVYALVRGKGVFPRVVRNLRVLANAVRNTALTRIKVNTVVNKNNADDIERLYELLCDIQIDEWSLLPLGAVGFAEDNIEEFALTAWEQIGIAKRLAVKYAQTRGRCPFIILPQFIYPLVNDYLQKKIGVRLPDPQICCLAAIDLGFISPDGILYPCERIPNEGYVGRTIGNAQIRAFNLVELEFYEIWNSDYFKSMFSLVVDKETYRAYEPCNRCRYLYSRRCNPCPLYSLDRGAHVETCEIAAAELGDISEARDGKECLESFLVPAGKKRPYLRHEVSEATMGNKIPKEVNGIRSTNIDGRGRLMLLNPYTVEYVEINEMGALLWRMMGEQRSVSQIASAFAEATAEALGQDGRTVPLNEIRNQLLPTVSAFFRELSASGFVDMPI